MKIETTDLCDKFSDEISVALPIGLKDFGGTKAFHGEIVTVKCLENNPFVRQTLEKEGMGKVLVVDGGGSKKCALMGDNIAELAISNHWNGIVIYGCIRDSVAVSKLPVGLKALDVIPLKSGKKNEGDVGVIVNFANIDFIPGHFVYADEDGIIVSKRRLH
ncbi:ribonuclease E activity regulator RraA [Pedobacter caeni]|uniref:4-hydroxy-4-methyl-2-oxoglutarate aldolase n=1 Tax=Pedobacter caeni TaxID=288992 RepID=A0A1M4WFR8_9SPHI|nr:ribonuclease E activity regulator RraA [Pedobacter caeni]SHE80076.1 regulator of ribonuclease activity A [Pedobacter caeni]